MREQDLIIALVILAVSALSTWVQKKRQEQARRELTDTRGQPRPAPGPRADAPTVEEPKPFDLEEHLRRLLEGDKPVEPPPPPPEIPNEPRPAPPPLPTFTPAEVVYTESAEPAAQAMGQLSEATQAYARAAQLHEATAARLRQTDRATEQARPVMPGRVRRTSSPAVAAAVAQLRTPQNVQQALITATLLGPPKALAFSEN